MKSVKKETSSRGQTQKDQSKKHPAKRSAPTRGAQPRSAPLKAQEKAATHRRATAEKEVAKRPEPKHEIKKAPAKMQAHKKIMKKDKIKKTTQPSKPQASRPSKKPTSPPKRLATRRSATELPGIKAKISASAGNKIAAKNDVHNSPARKVARETKSPAAKKASIPKHANNSPQIAPAAPPQRQKRIVKPVKDKKEKIQSNFVKKTLIKREEQSQASIPDAQILDWSAALQNGSHKIDHLTAEFRSFKDKSEGVSREVSRLATKLDGMSAMFSKPRQNNENSALELQTQFKKLHKTWEESAADIKKAVSMPSRAPTFDATKLQSLITPLVEKVELILRQQEAALQLPRHSKIQKKPSPQKEEKKVSPVQKKKPRQSKDSPNNTGNTAGPSLGPHKAEGSLLAEKAPKSNKTDPPKQVERMKIEAVEALLHAQMVKPESLEPASATNRAKALPKETANVARNPTQSKENNKKSSEPAYAKGFTEEEAHPTEDRPKQSVHPIAGSKIAEQHQNSAHLPLSGHGVVKIPSPPLAEQPKHAPLNAPKPLDPPKSIEMGPQDPAAVREFIINFNVDVHRQGKNEQTQASVAEQPKQRAVERPKDETKPLSTGLPLAMAPKPTSDLQTKTPVASERYIQEHKNPEVQPIKVFFDKSEESASKPAILPDARHHPAPPKLDEKRNFFS